MTQLNGEYYLHTNGSLIHKAIAGSVELDSDFVVKVWPDMLIAKSPSTFLAFLIEAALLGAAHSEIEHLARRNQLSKFIPDWEIQYAEATCGSATS